MWIAKFFGFLVKFALKKFLPFCVYFGFWCLNFYNMVMIPGFADEAVYRVWAAFFFPFGIVWGMVDAWGMVF